MDRDRLIIALGGGHGGHGGKEDSVPPEDEDGMDRDSLGQDLIDAIAAKNSSGVVEAIEAIVASCEPMAEDDTADEE